MNPLWLSNKTRIYSFNLKAETVGLLLRLVFESAPNKLGLGTGQPKYDSNWWRVSEHMQDVLECLAGQEGKEVEETV